MPSFSSPRMRSRTRCRRRSPRWKRGEPRATTAHRKWGQSPFPSKWGLSPLTQADEASLVRDGHGLGARDGIELGEDGLHVRLRGALGDLEAAGDVLVGTA